jgi:glycosyltransferase 2 family protein
MTKRFRSVLQYALLLGATVFLVWFSLRGIRVAGTENTLADKWLYLYKTWQLSDKGWLLLMAGLSMISHLIRAERWRMLLVSAGSNTTLHQSFLSLLIGYLVNLVIPRGGEISRCYNIQQLNKTSIEVSLGTVVMERIIDVLCLLAVLTITFLLQADKLFAFINSLPLGDGESNIGKLVIILAIAVILFGILAWFLWRMPKVKAWLQKIFVGFKEGLLSVLKLKRPGLFIIYSVGIWILYFIMSYVVMLAFPATNALGLGAVLSIFALGAIAMAAPLPGGAGAYHTLVPAGITFLYAITISDATAFVFVFHAWQTLIMIVAGAIALMHSSFLVKKQ